MSEDIFEHIKRHEMLHRCLDELVADMIQHTDLRPSQTTVMQLMSWSHNQMTAPTTSKEIVK